jgi:hypothetical protein
MTLAVNQIYQRAWFTLSNMKLPAAETDYWSGISWSCAKLVAGIEVRKTAFVQLRSKNKIWNNANNWVNIICKLKNKRKKCSKQLTKYPFKLSCLNTGKLEPLEKTYSPVKERHPHYHMRSQPNQDSNLRPQRWQCRSAFLTAFFCGYKLVIVKLWRWHCSCTVKLSDISLYFYLGHLLCIVMGWNIQSHKICWGMLYDVSQAPVSCLLLILFHYWAINPNFIHVYWCGASSFDKLTLCSLSIPDIHALTQWPKPCSPFNLGHLAAPLIWGTGTLAN